MDFGLMPNTEKIMAIASKFEKFNAEYVIIGSLAANFHGIRGATDNIDILVKKDICNIKKYTSRSLD